MLMPANEKLSWFDRLVSPPEDAGWLRRNFLWLTLGIVALIGFALKCGDTIKSAFGMS